MHQKLSVKPETGKLVIWVAYFTHKHRANPDLKEDKYIITGGWRPIMKEIENKNVDIDYEYSRKTYYELIEKSKESLDLMLEVAKESEHPRAFEVLGNMVKQIADVNDKLMDVNAKLKKVKNEEDIKQIGQTTNNLFVGTTTELQRLIQKENIIDVEPEE